MLMIIGGILLNDSVSSKAIEEENERRESITLDWRRRSESAEIEEMCIQMLHDNDPLCEKVRQEFIKEFPMLESHFSPIRLERYDSDSNKKIFYKHHVTNLKLALMMAQYGKVPMGFNGSIINNRSMRAIPMLGTKKPGRDGVILEHHDNQTIIHFYKWYESLLKKNGLDDANIIYIAKPISEYNTVKHRKEIVGYNDKLITGEFTFAQVSVYTVGRNGARKLW